MGSTTLLYMYMCFYASGLFLKDTPSKFLSHFLWKNIAFCQSCLMTTDELNAHLKFCVSHSVSLIFCVQVPPEKSALHQKVQTCSWS